MRRGAIRSSDLATGDGQPTSDRIAGLEGESRFRSSDPQVLPRTSLTQDYSMLAKRRLSGE
jgi:hypothetical protein